MFLNEALNKLKNLKSKVTRVEKYINECAVHDEDTAPQYNYEGEMVTRLHLQEEIVKLKTAIQRTNAATMATIDGQSMSLTELVLRNGRLRTELAFLKTQMEHTTSVASYRSNRSKDDIRKVFSKGCDKAYFKKEVDRIEQEKEQLEAAMAAANSSTPLIES